MTIDLPRSSYKVLGQAPSKWQIVLTLAAIVTTAVLWAVLL